MKKLIQFFLGLNAACLIRGLRFGLPDLIASGFAGLGAVYPFQNRAQSRCQQALKAIPEIRVDEILGARKVEIKLKVQHYEDGMMPSREAMVLLSILVADQPREVLEIGTFMGHTTRAMAENLEAAIIHTVDLPPDFSAAQNSQGEPPKDDFHLIAKRVPGREFKGLPVEQRIRQHFGDTAVLDFKTIGKPTFFFIDGSHTYEYCKLDSEKCFQICHGTGTFLWHDCDPSHPGVLQFILEWRKLGRNITRIEGTSIAYWKSA